MWTTDTYVHVHINPMMCGPAQFAGRHTYLCTERACCLRVDQHVGAPNLLLYLSLELGRHLSWSGGVGRGPRWPFGLGASRTGVESSGRGARVRLSGSFSLALRPCAVITRFPELTRLPECLSALLCSACRYISALLTGRHCSLVM